MKKLLIFALFIICMLSVVNGQETPVATPDISKNIIKLNLTSLPLKNFSLQYERVLTKSISGALTFSMMPETNMPNFIANEGIKLARDNGSIDAETESLIRNVLVSSYSITPEIRFYPGHKKYGTGFYIALFYQYGHYEASNLPIPFTNDLEEDIKIITTGKVTSHTGGFMLGHQWSLGRHMCLDWQMFGPHFGISSGDIVGLPTSPLSSGDQAKFEDEVNDINIPMLKPTIDATADKVKMTFDGPWGGIRFALAFGVKF
ncbi:MAG: DUF3575 domain-containing protein [Bacteroidales bacterium]